MNLRHIDHRKLGAEPGVVPFRVRCGDDFPAPIQPRSHAGAERGQCDEGGGDEVVVGVRVMKRLKVLAAWAAFDDSLFP